MSITNRWTVAAAAVIMQSGFGSLYAWSVFRQPLSAHYGTGVTRVNLTFFVAGLVFAISTFGAGFLLRRVGPRAVGIAGGVLFGLGVFLSAFAGGSLPLLYVTYGLVAAVGGGMGLIAPIVVLPRWFPEKPGLAYGLALVGFGLGTVINVPLISFLLSATGDPFRTCAILGISYAVLVGGAAWFVRHPPGERGHGRPRVPEAVDENRGRGDEGGSYDLGGALRTWQWYAIWVMFFLNTTVGLAVYSDAKAMAESIGGATTAAASVFVIVVSLVDTAGRLVWPVLSERIGGGGGFLALFVLPGAALPLFALVGGGGGGLVLGPRAGAGVSLRRGVPAVAGVVGGG